MNTKFELSEQFLLPNHGYIKFAQIGRPHGLKGGFFLKTSDRRTKWDGYKHILLETSDGFVEKKVKNTYLSGNALAIEIQDVTTREHVEALYNKNLYVHKTEIKLEENEYIVGVLTGYSVFIENKGLIGTITGVSSFGAQDNLEIEVPNHKEKLLYPFIDKFILSIQDDKKQIEILDIPEFFEGFNL